MGKRAIVLGADNLYRDKLETTIKSICAHNQNLKFYVFNDDIPKEWFYLMAKRLEKIDSEIVNIKVNSEILQTFSTPRKHIKYMAYFRYFIPNFVTESRALYLDCDIIVHKSLDDLFGVPFEDFYILAAADSWDKTLFNSGMMVVNVDKWKEDNICQQLLDLTREKHKEVFGDQGVLNLLFKDRWKRVPSDYNFLVGGDSIANSVGLFLQEWNPNDTHTIIHFEGEHKPWNNSYQTRYRELWWFYNGIDWESILSREEERPSKFIEIAKINEIHTAIFTNTQELENIEYLLDAFPNVQFHIFAYTNFGPKITKIETLPNVSLYPYFNQYQHKELMEKLDFYLDINHGEPMKGILEEVRKRNKQIFTFENTNHDSTGTSKIFLANEPETMAVAIREFLGKGIS